MITICLLILVYSFFQHPVDRLVKLLKGTDWKALTKDAWEKIGQFSQKGGRAATRPVLKFYYVMAKGDLSLAEKAIVYAGIVYITVPGDLLPVRILGWLGILDDISIAAWLYEKIGSCITPEIEQEVEATLDRMFGPETTAELITGCDQ